MNKVKGKKIGEILQNILMYVFLLLCLFAVIFTVFSKKDIDGAAEFFGYQMRVVDTDSMAKNNATDVSDFKIKSIPKNSMIFIQMVPDEPSEAAEWYSKLKVGDILTFRYVYVNQVTITHRITKITDLTAEGKGYIIELAGDNKAENTDQMAQTIYTADTDSMNYIIGKVTGQAKLLGFFMSALKNPLGIILIVIVPCFIIILLEVLKIVGVLTADRKKREQEISQQKDRELEELRRKLAQFEQQTKSADKERSGLEEAAEKGAESTREQKIQANGFGENADAETPDGSDSQGEAVCEEVDCE